MNIWGLMEFKGLKTIITPAFHSASKGFPVGYVIIGKEASIYHAGYMSLWGYEAYRRALQAEDRIATYWWILWVLVK